MCTEIEQPLVISSDNAFEETFASGDALNKFVENITEWNGSGQVTVSVK